MELARRHHEADNELSEDYANLSVKEAAELYQRTLSEDWED